MRRESLETLDSVPGCRGFESRQPPDVPACEPPLSEGGSHAMVSWPPAYPWKLWGFSRPARTHHPVKPQGQAQQVPFCTG